MTEEEEKRLAKGGEKSLSNHVPLRQQSVTVATSKKSLASIYAEAGSGVSNYVSRCCSPRGESSIFGSHLPLHSWLLKLFF